MTSFSSGAPKEEIAVLASPLPVAFFTQRGEGQGEGRPLVMNWPGNRSRVTQLLNPRSCDETLFEGEKCRPCAGGDTDLRIEALDVVVGGLGGDIELARRFLGGVAGRDQPQNLDFARCQTGEPRGRSPARGLTRGREHGFDGVGAQFSVLDGGAQYSGRACVTHRGPVRPRLARSLKSFGSSEQ